MADVRAIEQYRLLLNVGGDEVVEGLILKVRAAPSMTGTQVNWLLHFCLRQIIGDYRFLSPPIFRQRLPATALRMKML